MKTFLLTISFLLGCIAHLHCQIAADSVEYSMPLEGNVQIQALSTDPDATFEDIRNNRQWKPYDSSFRTDYNTAYWLKFKIKNNSNADAILYFFSSEDYVTTYQQTGHELQVFKNGNLFRLQERTNKSEYYFTKLELSPLQESVFYIKLSSNSSIQKHLGPSLLMEKAYLQISNNIRNEQSNSIAFLYFYIVSLFTIFFFALVFWIWMRERLYLYYLCYIFFQIIYGLQVLRSTTARVGNILSYIPELSTTSFQPVQFTFIGFYILFILYLLNIKKYDMLLARIVRYLAIFCFAYAAINFVANYFYFGLQYDSQLFILVRFFILPINLILFIWIIYKVKHPLLTYFIIGQSFFFIGSLTASYVGAFSHRFSSDHIFNFPQAPNIIFQTGLLAEVFCFSIALGKNIYLLQKTKDKATSKLISQLQENKQLQEGMNKELDKKINEKTEELIQIYSKIEKEKEETIKRDFSQKLKETEMAALRSQMNPHFLFNSLSALKHLIMSGQTEESIYYLDDFSGLLRGILQNSKQEKISVEQELEILELYLSLEKNRLGTGFEYSIQVDNREILSQFQIPPLILQPFVENAIWHGLKPSLKATKKLLLIFDTSDSLEIVIEDNGIGRKESAKNKKMHNSMGTNIVQDRLTLYNHLNDHSINLKITDLEKDGVALGTRITLTYEY